MKLYCFYLYDKKLSKEKYKRMIESYDQLDSKYPLYALTSDKKLMEKFIEQRDMNKFILVKKDIDKDVGIRYMNTHHGPVIQESEFTTYPKIKNNDQKEKKIKILTTMSEETYVKSCCEDMTFLRQESPFENEVNGSGSIMLEEFPTPYLLKTKYFDALEILEYVDFYKLNNGPDRQWLYNTDNDIDSMYDFPSIPDILFDEFRIFLFMFGKYFK